MSRRHRGRLRVLAGGTLLAALLAVMVLADYRLKQADALGYCPPDADWICYAPNVATLWSAGADSEIWERMRPHLLPLARRLELSVYRKARIRPTPARFRLWLGDGLLAAGNSDGVGFCVSPGLLTRAALWMNRVKGDRAKDGIMRHDDWHYAWRDGYLIVSPSRAYVAATLAGAALTLETAPAEAIARDALFVALRDPAANAGLLEVTMTPAPGLHLAGLLRSPQPRDLGQRVGTAGGGQWPGNAPRPIIELETQSSIGLAEAARAVSRRMPRVEALGPAAPHLRVAAAHLAGQWRLGEWGRILTQPDRSLRMILADIVVDGPIPIPVVAMGLQRFSDEAAHPVALVLRDLNPIPQEWHGAPGLLVPLLGDAITLCMTGTHDVWLVTTNETLMAQVTQEDEPQPEQDAWHVQLSVDWPLLAAHGYAIADQWRTLEVAPKLDQAAFGQQAQRVMAALEDLGTTSLRGWFTAEGLELAGRLCGGNGL
jgi:hypothetical protein